MHALEVAKVAWNGIIANEDYYDARELLSICKDHLGVAEEVLCVYGREGDEGGPLDEIETLKGQRENEIRHCS